MNANFNRLSQINLVLNWMNRYDRNINSLKIMVEGLRNFTTLIENKNEESSIYSSSLANWMKRTEKIDCIRNEFYERKKRKWIRTRKTFCLDLWRRFKLKLSFIFVVAAMEQNLNKAPKQKCPFSRIQFEFYFVFVFGSFCTQLTCFLN